MMKERDTKYLFSLKTPELTQVSYAHINTTDCVEEPHHWQAIDFSLTFLLKLQMLQDEELVSTDTHRNWPQIRDQGENLMHV